MRPHLFSRGSMLAWTAATILEALLAKRRAAKLSDALFTEGEQQTIRAVLALPPRESCTVESEVKVTALQSNFLTEKRSAKT